MSQEHLTFTFYSISVFQFFSQTVPGELHSHSVCPSCACSPTAWPRWPVTRIWPLTVLAGDQIRPWCESLTITCTTKLIYKATQGPDFSREKLLPQCCCVCLRLHCVEPGPSGMVSGCMAPQLNTMPGPNMSTGPKRMSSESTVWRVFVPFLFLFFQNISCFLGLWITDTGPLSLVNASLFSHHHPVFEADHYLLPGIHTLFSSALWASHSIHGLHRDAQVTTSPVRWSLSFKKYLAPSNIFAAWKWRSYASQMPWIVQYLCILAKWI